MHLLSDESHLANSLRHFSTALLRHVLTQLVLVALRETWYAVARPQSCRQVTELPGELWQILAAPGSRSCTIDTTHPGLPVFGRALQVTQSLLQVALPLVGGQSPVQHPHPIEPGPPKPADREYDSAACCRRALQSDAPLLWPGRDSLPAVGPRSHASG